MRAWLRTYAFDGLNGVGNNFLVDFAYHVLGLEVGCAQAIGQLGLCQLKRRMVKEVSVYDYESSP